MTDTATPSQAPEVDQADVTAETTYTVIGFWYDSEPVATGAIEGEHEVGGGDSVNHYFEGGPWALPVRATDMDEACGKAEEALAADLTADRDAA